jgi:hypothetical protein
MGESGIQNLDARNNNNKKFSPLVCSGEVVIFSNLAWRYKEKNGRVI